MAVALRRVEVGHAGLSLLDVDAELESGLKDEMKDEKDHTSVGIQPRQHIVTSRNGSVFYVDVTTRSEFTAWGGALPCTGGM